MPKDPMKAIHHVVHDYTNLISAGTEIFKPQKPPLNTHVQHSFLLHARKFHDFFVNNRGPNNQDIVACDYVPWKRPPLNAWKARRAHMNQHMFHLSYERLNQNVVRWTGYTENRPILEEFQAAWRLFLGKLPPDLKAEFDNEIDLKLAQATEYGGLNLR